MTVITVNGTEQELQVDPTTPLLWVLREQLELTGTKFGCGISQCGACTVHVNGVAMRSCITPISAVAGQNISTIEGLAPSADVLHPLQQAWIDEQVPQCGYCQSGQLMSAAALLAKTHHPQMRILMTPWQEIFVAVVCIAVFAKPLSRLPGCNSSIPPWLILCRR